MPNFDRVDWLLFAGASFIAVMALVGLMRNRRDQLLAQFRDEVERERQRAAQQAKALKPTPAKPKS